MKYTITFLPEVEDDAFNAYYWYEQKSKGLGEEFLRIFYANAMELTHNPFLYPKIYKDFRRRLLKRFPFAIYYILKSDEIIVYGLFHTARNPKVMKKILSNR